MAIAQDINLQPHRQSVAADLGGGQFKPVRKAGAEEEDLFQKFILDKESASVEKGKAVFDKQALDNEGAETNGFLSAREQQDVQQTMKRKVSNTGGRRSVPAHRPGNSGMVPVKQDAVEAGKKTTKAKVAATKSSNSPVSSAEVRGVEFKPSAQHGMAQKSAKPVAPQPLQSTLQSVARSDVTKPMPAAAKLSSRPQVAKDKSSGAQALPARSDSTVRADLASIARGQEQGESTASNTEGQGNPDLGQDRKQQNTLPSELTAQFQTPDSPQQSPQSLNQAASTTASLPQQGAYGGAVSQIAQQIFRLQQSGRSGTTRLTLDLPDGEKLLVRFHVQAGKGMQVQFSTNSKGLKDALKDSWSSLKVDATERGISLEDPGFEDVGSQAVR